MSIPVSHPFICTHIEVTSAPLIARSYKTAAIVYMTTDGIETAGSYDSQLEALSKVFIGADSVASSFSVEKIKSIGTSIIFAAGIPKCINSS